LCRLQRSAGPPSAAHLCCTPLLHTSAAHLCCTPLLHTMHTSAPCGHAHVLPHTTSYNRSQGCTCTTPGPLSTAASASVGSQLGQGPSRMTTSRIHEPALVAGAGSSDKLAALPATASLPDMPSLCKGFLDTSCRAVGTALRQRGIGRQVMRRNLRHTPALCGQGQPQVQPSQALPTELVDGRLCQSQAARVRT
jgi:hypothetical protein